MDKIWVKTEERNSKLLFLSLLAVLFTILVSSGNPTEISALYLIFIASSIFYYLIISRKKTDGYIILFDAVFISATFVFYLAMIFGDKVFTPLINLKTPLLAIIAVGLIIGLLPENVKSEIWGGYTLTEKLSR